MTAFSPVFPISALISASSTAFVLPVSLLEVALVASIIVILIMSIRLVSNLLLFLVLLLLFNFGIVLFGFLVSIADEEFDWLLQVDNVSASFEVVFLIQHIILPELDGLLLVLDSEHYTMLVELLPRVMRLTLKMSNIVVKESLCNILIESIVAESPQS